MVSVSVTLATTKTATNFETNVVTLGHIEIELIDEYYEKQPDYDPDESSDKHYSETNPPKIDPDTPAVPKIVSVKNTGPHDCYVRVLVYKTWKNGTKDLSGYITPNYDTTMWKKGDNITIGSVTYECYYYKDILKATDPDSVTTPLFESFAVGSFDLSDAGSAVGDIRVKAQAVQAEYVDIGATGTETIVRDASGMIVKWNGLVFD